MNLIKKNTNIFKYILQMLEHHTNMLSNINVITQFKEKKKVRIYKFDG